MSCCRCRQDARITAGGVDFGDGGGRQWYVVRRGVGGGGEEGAVDGGEVGVAACGGLGDGGGGGREVGGLGWIGWGGGIRGVLLGLLVLLGDGLVVIEGFVHGRCHLLLFLHWRVRRWHHYWGLRSPKFFALAGAGS